MQVQKKPALGKRSRYYQSQMDMEMLLAGEDYAELPNTYVIFICDFDPIGEGKYRYTLRMECCTFRINGAPFPRQRCKRLEPAVRYPFVVTC